MRLLSILIFTAGSVVGSSAFAADSVNVCNRGAIGAAITSVTNAPNCSVVNEDTMRLLQYLEVRGELVYDISPADLDGLDSLEVLDLNMNPISKIPTEALKKVPKLRRLNLGYCQIKSIPRGAFRYSRNLESLILSYGELEHIADGAFNGARKMHFLDVSYNPLKSMSISAVGLADSAVVFRSGDMRINP